MLTFRYRVKAWQLHHYGQSTSRLNARKDTALLRHVRQFTALNLGRCRATSRSDARFAAAGWEELAATANNPWKSRRAGQARDAMQIAVRNRRGWIQRFWSTA